MESFSVWYVFIVRENVKIYKKNFFKEYRDSEIKYRIWLIEEGVFV